MTSLREEELVKRGWHQVGAGHWVHPGVLAGEQRFTLEEAISYETIASVEESKKPVSVVAEKEDWQEEMRDERNKLCAEVERLDQLTQQYQKDLTDVAAILIPEVVAAGKGFTTQSLLDAARKAREAAGERDCLRIKLDALKSIDIDAAEKEIRHLRAEVEQLKSKLTEVEEHYCQNVNYVCYKRQPPAPETEAAIMRAADRIGKIVLGEDEEEKPVRFCDDQSVVQVAAIIREEFSAGRPNPELNCRDCGKPACEYLGHDREPTDLDCFKPKSSVEPTIEKKLEVLRRHSRQQEDSIKKLEDQLGPGGVWLALKGLEASVNRNIEGLRSQKESVQRALVRVHKNTHAINKLRTDLYPKEDRRREAMDESEDTQ